MFLPIFLNNKAIHPSIPRSFFVGPLWRGCTGVIPMKERHIQHEGKYSLLDQIRMWYNLLAFIIALEVYTHARITSSDAKCQTELWFGDAFEITSFS